MAAKRWIQPGIIVVACVLAFFIGRQCASPKTPGTITDPAHTHAQETIWTCSMHPQIQSPDPGLCPICAMDLIPLKEGGEVLEPNEVALSERALQLAQIRTAPVLRALDEASQIRLLGRVEEDESSARKVTAWTGGRIDKLHVQVTGERIRKGQVIATLYSPEVYAAHRDLLVAVRHVERLKDAPASSRDSAQVTVEAARTKLRLIGVPDAEIKVLETQTEPTTQIRIRSPFAGTVVERMATEGTYVQPGDSLYRLSDLSTVWVQLDAYEADLSRLAVGQTVQMEVGGISEVYEGKIAFLDPILDATRRTTRVRVEVTNTDRRLLPGMFAQAIVHHGNPQDVQVPLVIPDTAPIFTGRRSVVYVEVPGKDRPTYASREVRLGPKMGSVYPVVAGLQEAERVVVNGAFALDADLQIKGGRSMMAYGDDTTSSPLDEIVAPSTEEKKALASIVEAYLEVQEALAADDHARTLSGNTNLISRLEFLESSKDRQTFWVAWKPIRNQLIFSARNLGNSTTLEGSRSSFEPMSEAMERLLRVFGNPTDESLAVAHCPMAFNNRGASWVQREGTIDNSYFGATMRMCGDVAQKLDTGAYLVPVPEAGK